LMYDCLYKYSHKKLDKILHCIFFSFLFRDYVETGGFQKMIDSDETLNKNKEAYKEA